MPTIDEIREAFPRFEPDLMNEVIEVVQAHIKHLTEDLQVIRDVRSGKKS